jgi:NAD(P)-dependent dehydrogenase (short-subunit alcohol dehydrogenase family)
MEEKTVLVTGANRGIGREVCRQLATDGYNVILTSRDREKGEKAVEELQSEGVEMNYVQLDADDPQSISKAAKQVESDFGELDALVNNAAINYDSAKRAVSVEMEKVLDTLQTNLLGPWRVSQAFMPLLKKNRSARIVNVSSGSGSLSSMSGGTPAYGVSKAGLNALTIKLADELRGNGILVNAVCPGWVRTDMGGSAATRSVEEGAKSVIWAVTLPDDGPTGGFYRDGKKVEW